LVGLYDSQGVLRFAGRDREDCLAYADLFSLTEGSYSLESVAVLPSAFGAAAADFGAAAPDPTVVQLAAVQAAAA
jgi:hypothetical protein